MKSEPSDAELISRARTGDAEAYELLVERHQRTVARVAVRVTGGREGVEDLVQEVFLKVFRELPRFQGRSSFVTWVYRIAVNESVEAVRRDAARWRRHEEFGRDPECLPDSLIVADPASGERLALDRELQGEVQAALSRLPADMRAVLTLRYLEDLSTPEVAQVLDLPEGTVRSRLYYARLRLSELLRPCVEPVAAGKQRKRE